MEGASERCALANDSASQEFLQLLSNGLVSKRTSGLDKAALLWRSARRHCMTMLDTAQHALCKAKIAIKLLHGAASFQRLLVIGEALNITL